MKTESAPIPGRPFRGRHAARRAFRHLSKFHAVELYEASNRLHQLKQQAGLSPDDNVVIGRTGDVYVEQSGERIGSLTDRALDR